MKVWKKKSQEEIKEVVFEALKKNVNYHEQTILGLPASYLDEKVFNQDASFIKDAPYISTLIQNPNHIGCHTLGKSESHFQGTQEIEKELIEICAVDILKGEPNQQDGYVASGGTEANIQAVWVYRNLFQKEYGASNEEMTILCSSDSHYSMDKAANILSIDVNRVEVEDSSREIQEAAVISAIEDSLARGKKYFIVVCNMMTTMFGSVDDINVYVSALKKTNSIYKIHVDGAYGGFYYPFSNEESELTFKNPEITSFTLDAHKMAQAPYGTGIFLIRKGFIQNVYTKEASYVEGEDITLIGSRAGANAIAAWMILVKNGPYGWQEKVYILQKRTTWMCQQLDDLGIPYYRNPFSNLITMRSHALDPEICQKYGLIPDSHHQPNWHKIVVMEHVTIEKLAALVDEIKPLPELSSLN
ncbi:MAG: aspartate aminotransferase family protein [Flavobacteriales bacterium]|nr:aspartate aminotransferase family protein [Flavobacteriales bacterium]